MFYSRIFKQLKLGRYTHPHKQDFKREGCTSMFIVAPFKTAYGEQQPKRPLTDEWRNKCSMCQQNSGLSGTGGEANGEPLLSEHRVRFWAPEKFLGVDSGNGCTAMRKDLVPLACTFKNW